MERADVIIRYPMVMHGGMPNTADNNRYKFETRFFTNWFVNHSTVYRTCNSHSVGSGSYANALQYVCMTRCQRDAATIPYSANADEYEEQQVISSTTLYGARHTGR